MQSAAFIEKSSVARAQRTRKLDPLAVDEFTARKRRTIHKNFAAHRINGDADAFNRWTSEGGRVTDAQRARRNLRAGLGQAVARKQRDSPQNRSVTQGLPTRTAAEHDGLERARRGGFILKQTRKLCPNQRHMGHALKIRPTPRLRAHPYCATKNKRAHKDHDSTDMRGRK